MTTLVNDNIVRLPEVKRRTGLSRTTIYRRQAVGTFPSSVKLGENCVGWYERDINTFVADPMGWRAAEMA